MKFEKEMTKSCLKLFGHTAIGALCFGILMRKAFSAGATYGVSYLASEVENQIKAAKESYEDEVKE